MAAADLTGDHAALRYGLDMVAIAQPSVSRDWEAVVREQIATNAPIDETLPRLVALVETQIPEAIGSLLLQNNGPFRRWFLARCPAQHKAP